MTMKPDFNYKKKTPTSLSISWTDSQKHGFWGDKSIIRFWKWIQQIGETERTLTM